MSSYSEYVAGKRHPGGFYLNRLAPIFPRSDVARTVLSIAVITYVSLETGCFRKSSRAVTTFDDATVNAQQRSRHNR